MKNASFVKKTFYAMLIPTIFMNLVTCLNSAADTIIVGNFLGEEALAAITFSIPIYMIINTIASLLAVGGATAVGNAIGRGEKEKADEIFSASIIFAVLLSVFMAVPGAALIEHIVKILGARGTIANLTVDYALVVFYMMPAFIINISLAFFVRSDGRPALAMYSMVVSIIANIVLDIVFIAFLHMGVAGAAWATGISQVISALIMLTHFYSKKNTLRFIKKLPFEKAALIFKSGAGTSLHFLYQFITILFFNNLIMGISGGGGIVVYTVVINVLTIAMSIFEGLSQTVQPMFSVYYGENNHKAMSETVKLSAFMTLVLGLGVTALLEFFPYPLIKAFGVTNPILVADSAIAIRIFSACIVIMTFNTIMGYFYQSTERGGLTAAIVASRNLVMLLLGAVILGHWFGANGIWGSYMFAETVTLAMWLLYALYKGRKSSSTIFLLPPEGSVYLFYMPSACELNEALTGIRAFLDEQHISGEINDKITSAVSEFLTSVKRHNDKLKRIEIRVTVGGEVSLIIRDDGISLDQSEFGFRQTAKSFEYGAVLGINRMLVKY